MRTATLILILLVPASPPAAGQEGGETALFDQASALRLEIERLDDTRGEVVKQRDRLADRLNGLAGKINKHKADHPDGSLLPDFALQDMLKRARDLSESLTLLNKELEALRSVRTERLQRLGQLYGRLVDLTAGKIRNTRGARQKALVKVLARVRRERDLIRRELGSGPAPRPPMETQNLLASEDPEELSERADAVSDEQDRLRLRLASLDKSIAEIRADRRLERDMRDFVEDHSLFGEESRILQLSKPTSATDGLPNNESEQGGRQEYNGNPLADEDPDPGEGAIGGLAPGTGDSSSVLDGTQTSGTQAGQVPVNLDGSDSDLGPMNPEQKIQLLRRRRRQLVERIKKLQILHDRLREKAESLTGE